MDKGMLFMMAALGLIGIGLFVFERKTISTKEIVLIASLAALAALGRVFSIIPSAQPTTFFIIITGYVFGCRAGFMVGVFAPLISNIFLGQGPWTIVQMLCWGSCGVSAGILGKIFKGNPKILLLVFSFIWGLLYGWLTNIWYWVSFIYPLNFATWVMTNVSSFWFDCVHAATNCILMYVLGNDFIAILNRFKLKLNFSRIMNRSINVSWRPPRRFAAKAAGRGTTEGSEAI